MQMVSCARCASPHVGMTSRAHGSGVDKHKGVLFLFIELLFLTFDVILLYSINFIIVSSSYLIDNISHDVNALTSTLTILNSKYY